jgi:hypothetical protein
MQLVNSAMQNAHSTNKNLSPPGLDLSTSGLKPHCTSHSSWETFLDKTHPQPYLLGADMENSTLINHSLVC